LTVPAQNWPVTIHRQVGPTSEDIERNLMSAVCILTPIVIAAWPAFSAAVVAAASSLGYQLATHEEEGQTLRESRKTERSVQLAIDQSELVTDRLGRDRQISVSRDEVTVTFSRDARGKAAVCVSGTGRTDAELRAMGQELSQRVVQQYVYQRLKEEIATRQFVVLEEQVDESQTIHMKVRHWQGAV
jgi:hypothetical protein